MTWLETEIARIDRERAELCKLLVEQMKFPAVTPAREARKFDYETVLSVAGLIGWIVTLIGLLGGCLR